MGRPEADQKSKSSKSIQDQSNFYVPIRRDQLTVIKLRTSRITTKLTVRTSLLQFPMQPF